ncbi:MAG: hypothetical protein ABI183_00635 [Polyangiaceae bacterium]
MAPSGEDAARDAEIAKMRADIARLDVEPRFHFSGFAQTDWVVTNQASQDQLNTSTGAPLNQDRFLLRRGHLRADVDYGLVLGSLEIDANTVNGPQVRPIDAEASFRWPAKPSKNEPYLMATIGLMRTPFGFEVLEHDNDRPFLERSTVIRALFPGEFDLGLRLQGGWRFLNYALGLMNGDPIGENQFPGRDPNQSKDLVFRAGFESSHEDRIRIEGGMSGVTGSGFHSGTASTKDTLVWRDLNEDGVVSLDEIQVISGKPATPSQNFHRFAIGADLRLIARLPVIGNLVLRGEVVRASNLDRGLEPADPVGAGHDLREIGWTLGFVQDVTQYGFFGVRYDRYNPDSDANTQQGINVVPTDRSYSTTAFLIGLRYADPNPPARRRARYVGRLLFEYDHNTNPLGLSANGQPTTLASDALTVRGEVSF